jgi:hypothetical protein
VFSRVLCRFVYAARPPSTVTVMSRYLFLPINGFLVAALGVKKNCGTYFLRSMKIACRLDFALTFSGAYMCF